MKRMCLLVTLLLAGVALCAEESTKAENMSSFMGMRWCITKASYERNFKDNFKGKRNQFKDILGLRSQEIFKNPISLVFSDPATGESEAEEEPPRKIKSGEMILTGACIKIDSEKFADLVDVFKIKYGEPSAYNECEIQNMYGAKLIQQVVTWDNPSLGRSIIMRKFAATLNQGVIEFVRYKSEEEKQRELEKLLKEREERLQRAASLL